MRIVCSALLLVLFSAGTSIAGSKRGKLTRVVIDSAGRSITGVYENGSSSVLIDTGAFLTQHTGLHQPREIESFHSVSAAPDAQSLAFVAKMKIGKSYRLGLTRPNSGEVLYLGEVVFPGEILWADDAKSFIVTDSSAPIGSAVYVWANGSRIDISAKLIEKRGAPYAFRYRADSRNQEIEETVITNVGWSNSRTVHFNSKRSHRSVPWIVGATHRASESNSEAWLYQIDTGRLLRQ